LIIEFSDLKASNSSAAQRELNSQSAHPLRVEELGL